MAYNNRSLNTKKNPFMKNKTEQKTKNKNKLLLNWAQKAVDYIIKTRQKSNELSHKVIKVQENNLKLKKNNKYIKLQALLKDMTIAKHKAEIAQLKLDLEKQKLKTKKDLPKPKEANEMHQETEPNISIKHYLDESALIGSIKPFLDTLFK